MSHPHTPATPTPVAVAPPIDAKAVKAAEKAVKAAAKITQNGVTRPAAGTQTGRIWVISDNLSSEAGKPIERKAVIAKALEENLNESTAATQYGRWRKFHGLKAAPATPATPDAAAQTTPAQ